MNILKNFEQIKNKTIKDITYYNNEFKELSEKDSGDIAGVLLLFSDNSEYLIGTSEGVELKCAPVDEEEPKIKCSPVDIEEPEYPKNPYFENEPAVEEMGIFPTFNIKTGGLAPPHVSPHHLLRNCTVVPGNTLWGTCSIKDYEIITADGTVINIKNKKIILTLDYKKWTIDIEKDEEELDKDAEIQDHYNSFEIGERTAKRLQFKYKNILKLRNGRR